MRVIVIGCEYTGVSTLINGIHAWGLERGINHHLDDHFTIPDAYHLSDEEQQGMLDMLPGIKERFQRFQIAYHVRLINKYKHILLGGFYMEEMVYGPRYYYPGTNARRVGDRSVPAIDHHECEPELPKDTIVVHLHAEPDVIRRRMESDPHPHQLVPPGDVEGVIEEFAHEYQACSLKGKFDIDTSKLTPAALLEEYLRLSIPHLNAEDGNTRLLTV